MGIGASTPRKDPPRSNMVRLHTVDNAKLPMPEQPELERRFTKVLVRKSSLPHPNGACRTADRPVPRRHASPLYCLALPLASRTNRSRMSRGRARNSRSAVTARQALPKCHSVPAATNEEEHASDSRQGGAFPGTVCAYSIC
ncbi:hypothetical protein MTO96_000560 [Rhipicephalus appendiculatus]